MIPRNSPIVSFLRLDVNIKQRIVDYRFQYFNQDFDILCRNVGTLITLSGIVILEHSLNENYNSILFNKT